MTSIDDYYVDEPGESTDGPTVTTPEGGTPSDDWLGDVDDSAPEPDEPTVPEDSLSIGYPGSGVSDPTQEGREERAEETTESIERVVEDDAETVRENTSPEAIAEEVRERTRNGVLPWWVTYVPILLLAFVGLYLLQPVLGIAEALVSN